MKNRCLFILLCILPMLCGCNESDDVVRIFTGKTWKLTDVLDGGTYPIIGNSYDASSNPGYWSSNEAKEASIKLLETENNFTITFTGVLTNKTISGGISGRAASTSFTGSWSADAESNYFTAKPSSTSDNDALGKAFLNGLNNATSYEGDENNLYIYFKEGQRTRCLLFHVQE